MLQSQMFDKRGTSSSMTDGRTNMAIGLVTFEMTGQEFCSNLDKLEMALIDFIVVLTMEARLGGHGHTAMNMVEATTMLACQSIWC